MFLNKCVRVGIIFSSSSEESEVNRNSNDVGAPGNAQDIRRLWTC